MLEREFAAQMNVPGAVATGYGRSALWLALEAVNVRGAEVAVPNFICAQVPEAVRRAGGQVAFYPVRQDLRIDADDFHAALTPQTRVAIVAHYLGRPHENVAALAKVCRRRSIVLVEDCALALGACVGTIGDLAIFSFTKSDWCYGGGMVVTGVRDWLARLGRLRDERLLPAERMARRYGLLRRADFVANRPPRARVAEFAGRQMQGFFARREPALADANFYDAAPWDAAMPEFAARRALKILRELRATTSRRIRLCDAIRERLAKAPGVPEVIPETFRVGHECSTGNHAFMCLGLNHGTPQRLNEVVAAAARAGVTLRRCWPAYQELEPGQHSDDLQWLADHMLLVEIHPALTNREVVKIAAVLTSAVGI